jgi:pilus assembly protein Flp/PilA
MTLMTWPRSPEDGAAAVEYGVLLGFVAAAVITAVTALGGGVEDTFERTCRALAAGSGSSSAGTPAGVGGGLATAPGLARRRC